MIKLIPSLLAGGNVSTTVDAVHPSRQQVGNRVWKEKEGGKTAEMNLSWDGFKREQEKEREQQV